MKAERLAIPDVILITPPKFGDARGFFSETFNAPRFAEAGISLPFLQDNQSLSAKRGTIRGLHCQLPPHAQGKLVRVTKGAVWDVAVDARVGSATYGKWVGAELSAENWSQLWVPPGFLHGFVTLTDDTEFVYKCTDVYDKSSERAVIWNDPDLAIAWPIAENEILLSDKDKVAASFNDSHGWFTL